MSSTEKRKNEEVFLRGLAQETKKEVFQTKQNYLVIDGVTYNIFGERIGDSFELIAKTTEYQQQGLTNMNDINMHGEENGGFFFMFYRNTELMRQKFPTLSPQDIARLMFIGTYMSYENRLIFDNSVSITKKHLEELIGLSTKRFNQLYKRYKDANIIEEQRDGTITINPEVMRRGAITGAVKRTGYDYTRVYRDTTRKLYDEFKGRRLGQLAIIFSVMPFLNGDTNIICHNPREKDTNLLKPMTLTELADLLEYTNPQKLKTALRAITLGGERIFTFVEDVTDARQFRVIVNPRAIYGGGDSESLKATKALFNK